jgi:hypothetical protein
MAMTMTLLTSGSSSDPGVNTAVITPTANALVLVGGIGLTSNTGMTVAGNSLTYVNVGSVSIVGPRVLNLFRALGGAPTAGAVNISYTDSGTSNQGWFIAEVTEVDTSGVDGSGAIVQSATATAGSSVTSLTVTLGAFGGAANGTFGLLGTRDPVGGYTPGVGFTQIANVNTVVSTVAAQWRTDNSTDVSCTWGADFGTQAGGIAIEIKSGLPASTPSLTGTHFHERLVSRGFGRGFGR